MRCVHRARGVAPSGACHRAAPVRWGRSVRPRRRGRVAGRWPAYRDRRACGRSLHRRHRAGNPADPPPRRCRVQPDGVLASGDGAPDWRLPLGDNNTTGVPACLAQAGASATG